VTTTHAPIMKMRLGKPTNRPYASQMEAHATAREDAHRHSTGQLPA
jgi:hypothetical protein